VGYFASYWNRLLFRLEGFKAELSRLHASCRSYWNRPLFPETCKVASLDDRATYDTTVRIAGSWLRASAAGRAAWRTAGSWAGTAQAFQVLAALYSWTHIVLVSDDAASVCRHGARPFSAVFGNDPDHLDLSSSSSCWNIGRRAFSISVCRWQISLHLSM